MKYDIGRAARRDIAKIRAGYRPNARKARFVRHHRLLVATIYAFRVRCSRIPDFHSSPIGFVVGDNALISLF